jgi:hypothetical protein
MSTWKVHHLKEDVTGSDLWDHHQSMCHITIMLHGNLFPSSSHPTLWQGKNKNKREEPPEPLMNNLQNSWWDNDSIDGTLKPPRQ